MTKNLEAAAPDSRWPGVILPPGANAAGAARRQGAETGALCHRNDPDRMDCDAKRPPGA